MSEVPFAECKAPVMPVWRAVDAVHLGFEGLSSTRPSTVAEEVPVALRYGGFAHAVMMATPDDLTDFVLGFSLTEGIISTPADVAHLAMHETDDGISIDIALEPQRLRQYLANRRVRMSRGHTSCGICGVEDLRDVRRPPSRVAAAPDPVSPIQVRSALDALRDVQTLSRLTRGAHASAWIGIDGNILAVREDVGRHNALDKLIGAGLRGAFDATAGFCLITSRCSFEMVQKAVAAGYGTLVSVSAPTAMAIRTAAAAGLTLFSMGRDDGQILYTAPVRSEGDVP